MPVSNVATTHDVSAAVRTMTLRGCVGAILIVLAAAGLVLAK